MRKGHPSGLSIRPGSYLSCFTHPQVLDLKRVSSVHDAADGCIGIGGIVRVAGYNPYMMRQMEQHGRKEQQFFKALKNIFVGVPVEGESGYINLMRIKARYFEKVMEPHLRETIDAELQRFPDFREELFDKLYTFFRRYFTESGSIGFFFTPYHQSVYE
jgi:hypothetical protein